MLRIKKGIAIAALGLCFTTVCGVAALKGVEAVAERAVAVEYVLPLSYYELAKENEDCTIYNSKGEEVEIVDGKFFIEDLGDYRIECDGALVKLVRVLSEMPEAEFSFTETLPDGVIAGSKAALPKATIASEVEEVEEYDLQLIYGDKVVASWKNINSSVDYRFMRVGEYLAKYSFVNCFGITEYETVSITTQNERIIVCEEILPTVWGYYNACDLGEIYGYYNEKRHDAVIEITAPDGSMISPINGEFTPKQVGRYEMKITSELSGESLEITSSLEVELAYSSLLYAAEGTKSIKNGVATAQDYVQPSVGVEALLSGDGAKVYYNKIIDLNTLSKEQSVLTFYFDTAKTTATKIRATLIDANDENNKLSVYWYHSPWNSDRNSFMLAEFNGYTLGLASDFAKPDEVFGRTLNSSFKRTDNMNAFNFSYDIQENAVYTKALNSILKVMDVDDTKILGNKLPFKGFSSGEVYLRLELLESATAGVIISEVAGQKLSGESGVDLECNNYLRLRYDDGFLKDGELHQGAFGYYYRLPTPVNKDLLVGEFSVETKLFKIEQGERVDISDQIKADGGFYPKELGQYAVRYSCVDSYGNLVEKEYSFGVSLLAPKITVENQPYSQLLGTFLQLPEIQALGGTGKLRVQTQYYYNGERVEPDEENRIYLDRSGKITVQAFVTDFLGESVQKSFDISVDNDVRMLNIQERPVSFLSGREYELPDFTPINHLFEEGETGRNMSKTILINGETIGADRKYTFAQTGEYTITYIGGYGEEYETVEEWTVRVLPAGADNNAELKDYLLFSNEVQTYLFENGFAIEAEEDFVMTMPHAVSVSKFQFDFSAVEELTNYSKLQILLTDYQNAAEQVLIELIPNANGNFTVYLNGGTVGYSLATVVGKYGDKVGVQGGYNGRTYYAATFKLYDKEALITAENDVKICALTEYLSGKAFKGFSSGLMRMSVTVCGVEEKTSLIINAVSNQTFTSIAFRRGDKQGAAISLLGDFVKKAAINEKVVIPAAVAYDVLQGKAVSLVGYIQQPNGEKVSFSPDKPTEFTVTDYGSYLVTYEAKDYFGNTGKYEYYILCQDATPPVVIVPSGIALSYKVGDKLTVVDFEAEDNVAVTQKTVLVITPAGKIVVASGGYTFTAKGKYEIVLYAQDEKGNYGTKTITVEVN